LAGLDEVFAKADLNGNGKIDEHEFEHLINGYLAHNGIELTEHTFDHFLTHFREHHSSVEEFDKEEFEKFVDRTNVRVIIPAIKKEMIARGLDA